MQFITHLVSIVTTLLLHKIESSYVLINIGSTNVKQSINETKLEGPKESTVIDVGRDMIQGQTVHNSGFFKFF